MDKITFQNIERGFKVNDKIKNTYFMRDNEAEMGGQ
jgi:hypothetical protein